MIRYSEITQGDIRHVVNRYEQYLNSGEYIKTDIFQAFHAKGYIGYKAQEGGKIVGIVSGRRGIAFTYPHLELEAELSSYVSGRSVYTVDCLLVLPEYRHAGIARNLIYCIRRWLKGAKTELVLAEIWIYPDASVPAAAAFAYLGRTVFHRAVPEFYKESEAYRIGCPICGKRCRCGALIEMYLL